MDNLYVRPRSAMMEQKYSMVDASMSIAAGVESSVVNQENKDAEAIQKEICDKFIKKLLRLHIA
jgi:hypothetical protein